VTRPLNQTNFLSDLPFRREAGRPQHNLAVAHSGQAAEESSSASEAQESAGRLVPVRAAVRLPSGRRLLAPRAALVCIQVGAVVPAVVVVAVVGVVLPAVFAGAVVGVAPEGVGGNEG
jgi:hypothetical protein